MIKVIIKKIDMFKRVIRKSYSSQLDCIIADNYKFSKNYLFISFKIDNSKHLKKGITGFSEMNGTDGSAFIVGIKLPKGSREIKTGTFISRFIVYDAPKSRFYKPVKIKTCFTYSTDSTPVSHIYISTSF